MSEPIDLQRIETQAFRSIHSDGLQDIYIGGVLLSLTSMATALDDDPFNFGRFLLFLGLLGLFNLLYKYGRRRITGPRLGEARFGPQRQKRSALMKWIMAGIVLLQVLVLLGSTMLWANPQWGSSLGLDDASLNRGRLLVASICAAFAGVGTLVPAYFNEYLRGYYISVIVAAAVFTLVYIQQPVYLVAAGFAVMLPGLVLFARFLHEHPRPQVEP